MTLGAPYRERSTAAKGLPVSIRTAWFPARLIHDLERGVVKSRNQPLDVDILELVDLLELGLQFAPGDPSVLLHVEVSVVGGMPEHSQEEAANTLPLLRWWLLQRLAGVGERARS